MTTHIKEEFNNLSKIAEIELVYRNKLSASQRPHIKSSIDAYKFLLGSWDMDKIELQEQFRVMLLDRKGSCMGIATLATGGVSDCPVDSKLVFGLALKASAVSIIVAHNHPSGNLTPSKSDEAITAQLSKAGEILKIPVLDHLVISKEGYTSFADEGLLITSSKEDEELKKFLPPEFAKKLHLVY